MQIENVELAGWGLPGSGKVQLETGDSCSISAVIEVRR